MRLKVPHILIFTVLLIMAGQSASAQFREEKVEQDYGKSKDDTTKIFSVKDYFAGLSHKKEITLGTAFIGSTVCIGGMQIYEDKKWKLPVIYGGLGASLGTGILFNAKYNNSLGAEGGGNDTYKNLSTAMFITAGAIYWGTLLDGAITFKSDTKPLAARSTVFSILCPGLGQIYNGEAWKVPIYLGGIGAGIYFTSFFNQKYVFYRDKYISDRDSGSKYYRDTYRRYRDYALLASVALYVLQAVDANVFAFMQDFSVNEDITMNVEPTVIAPDMQFAWNQPAAYGLKLGFSF